MQIPKAVLGALAAVAVILAGCKPASVEPANTGNENANTAPVVNANTNATPDTNTNTGGPAMGSVKEFTMTSFYELVDGKPKPQFSLREISVKKGDTVRIKVTNTKGDHDFKLDEFNVYAATPLDQEVVVEFTADKAGEFVYYCSKPNHRALGQWGTLKVTDAAAAAIGE